MIKRLAILVLLPLVGCSVVTNMTTEKVDFALSVQNQSTQPIRIGLAKNGPPFEEEWASPEEVAMGNPKRPDVNWGQTVLPGQTATVPMISGRFSEHVSGFVRVYAGDPQLSDMLAMGVHSPNRLDLRLNDGSNRFVIFDDGDHLGARRLPPAAAPAATKK